MRLSEERVRQIADKIVDVLYDDELLDYAGRLEALIVQVEKTILEDLKMEDRISQEAADQLKTYSREIISGTAEWMILHETAMEELAIALRKLDTIVEPALGQQPVHVAKPVAGDRLVEVVLEVVIQINVEK